MRCLVLLAIVAVARAGFLSAPAAVVAPAIAETGSSIRSRTEDGLGNYAFGYDEIHTTGGSFRTESGNALGIVRGAYGLRDADGRGRIVNYVADAAGFRANIQTNEPGVDPSRDPAATLINKQPVALAAPAIAAPALAAPAIAAPALAPALAAPALAPALAAPAFAAPAIAPAIAPAAVSSYSTVQNHIAPARIAAPVAVAAPAIAAPAAISSYSTVQSHVAPARIAAPAIAYGATHLGLGGIAAAPGLGVGLGHIGAPGLAHGVAGLGHIAAPGLGYGLHGGIVAGGLAHGLGHRKLIL